jgi:hypothetical protein
MRQPGGVETHSGVALMPQSRCSACGPGRSERFVGGQGAQQIEKSGDECLYFGMAKADADFVLDHEVARKR